MWSICALTQIVGISTGQRIPCVVAHSKGVVGLIHEVGSNGELLYFMAPCQPHSLLRYVSIESFWGVLGHTINHFTLLVGAGRKLEHMEFICPAKEW